MDLEHSILVLTMHVSLTIIPWPSIDASLAVTCHLSPMASHLNFAMSAQVLKELLRVTYLRMMIAIHPIRLTNMPTKLDALEVLPRTRKNK